ncbi:U7 snRNA-associated Sm-like protein LSm11 [Erpetoichthys calabaricus]|uniref:LSM11, U7 small nuclear RNA associated n=1 Tax=Erpetoichthys calabaricus TaxID=27687 RepID=A0A8C4XB30_ERPCA|nr:U7 snRNA-associated Sm-like protein LSm11 [Erpetoichthys calabaricus]
MEEAERTGGKEGTSEIASCSSANVEPSARLDVLSEFFDPLLALYAPDIQLPYPNVKCFNNLAQYESFLKRSREPPRPENVSKRKGKARKGVPDPERIERLKKLIVKPATTGEDDEAAKSAPRKSKGPRNVLTRMAVHTGSPLGELYRCVKDQIRIKVHIRTFKGLRGVCSGFLVAFDKFWNMALVDVDETYRKPVLGEAFYHEPALTVTRLFDRLKLQEDEEALKLRSVPEKTTGKAESGAQDLGEQLSSPGLRRSPRKSCGRNPSSVVQSKTKPAEAREKVDYQRVHLRHVNQLFIRGENVLLVCLAG